MRTGDGDIAGRDFKLYCSRTLSGVGDKKCLMHDLPGRRELRPGLRGTQELQSVLRNSYSMPGP